MCEVRPRGWFWLHTHDERLMFLVRFKSVKLYGRAAVAKQSLNSVGRYPISSGLETENPSYGYFRDKWCGNPFQSLPWSIVCFFSIPCHAAKAGKNSSVNAAARGILLLLLSLGITNVYDIGMLLIQLSSFGHDHSVIALHSFAAENVCQTFLCWQPIYC